MQYTLHQLLIFQKLSETKSITKAAEELHLTQPAVSIQLKNFQAQFDLPLYEVIGRQLYITDFGNEIVKSCDKILQETHEISNRLMAYKGHLIGQLKISVVSTGKYVMPYFLSAFLKRFPGIDLVMDVTNKSKVIKSLRDNEVDFSLVSVIPDNLDLTTIKLMKNQLFLVGNREYTSEDPVDNLSLLTSTPLLFREGGSATRQAMEQFIRRNNLQVKKKIELTSNEAVKQSVVAGLGISIMPLIGIKNELKNKDLKIIPCKGLPVSTFWNLVSLKGKRFSPVASAFSGFIEENKNQIIKDQFNWYESYIH
jgi:DNA-binding transcriptional LysR family regulator